MKSLRTLLMLALGLWPVIAVSDHDTRMTVFLDESERHDILWQMHFFMQGVNDIVNGLARNDMKAVAAAARERGRRMPNRIPAEVRAKLPTNFTELGKTVHFAFDDLANDAEGFGDPKTTLEQLGGVLARCNACHAIYQIRSSTYDPMQHMK